MEKILDRFLRYVSYDTQSCETSETQPSTDKQLKLLRVLRDERFIKYLDAFKAKAEVEQIFEGGNTGFQVRIRYAE